MQLKRAIITLAILSALSSAPCAQEFVEKKLGDDALVLTARFGWWEVNTTAVATEEGLVVVDTLYSPRAALKAREIIERFSDKPIRYVVNTHAHADHAFGNAAFPEAVIVGHETCPAELRAEVARQLEACKRFVPDLEKQLVAAKETNPAQAEILAERLAWMKNMITLIEDEGFQPTPPALTIAEEAEIHLGLGGKSIRVFHLASYHSSSDIVVFVPAGRLLIVGDLYHGNNLPYINTDLLGDPDVLLRVYDRLLSFADEVEYVVPGHGDVTGIAYLRRQRAYLRDLVDAVEQAQAGDLNLEQAKEQIKLSEYSDFSNFAAIHEANLENCWRASSRAKENR